MKKLMTILLVTATFSSAHAIWSGPSGGLGPIFKSTPKRLKEWDKKRDPWPLNSFAIKAGIELLSNKTFYEQWINKIHSWINTEKKLIYDELSIIDNLKIHNSSTNFFLIESQNSLSSNIKYLENKGILIRDCSSFRCLNKKWARISIQSSKNNKILCSRKS